MSRFSRSAASRAGSGSARALTRCAAASCSTTGPPRSMVVRAAAKRWIRGSPARIQPVRSPAQCDLLSDPMDTTAGLNAAMRGGAGAVEVQLPQRLVHHQHSARRRGRRDQAAPLRIGHQPAGGVVEVRHHVGHRGPLLQQRRFHRVEIPAGRAPTSRRRLRRSAAGGSGHGHRHRAAARGPDGVERVRVARVLHEHLVRTGPARVRSTMFRACCAPEVTRICAAVVGTPAAV